MENKKLYVTGKLINKGIFYDNKSADKYDTKGEYYHYSIADAKVEYVGGEVGECEHAPKWFGKYEVDFVNFKSKDILPVYDTNNMRTLELPASGSVVKVAFNVTERAIYPVAVKVLEYKEATNPFA